MVVNEEEKRRIIDLHFNQGKTIREVSRIMGKSSHDITPVTKEHRIQLVQKYALTNGEHSGVVQREQDRVISNVKAYNLFDTRNSRSLCLKLLVRILAHFSGFKPAI
jgi:transposase